MTTEQNQQEAMVLALGEVRDASDCFILQRQDLAMVHLRNAGQILLAAIEKKNAT